MNDGFDLFVLGIIPIISRGRRGRINRKTLEGRRLSYGLCIPIHEGVVGAWEAVYFPIYSGKPSGTEVPARGQKAVMGRVLADEGLLPAWDVV